MLIKRNFLNIFPGIILIFIARYLSLEVQSAKCISKSITTCIDLLQCLSYIIFFLPFILSDKLKFDIILVFILFIYFIILIIVTVLFLNIKSDCFKINPFLFILNSFLAIILSLFFAFIGPLKSLSLISIIFGVYFCISTLFYYLYCYLGKDKKCESQKNYNNFIFYYGIVLIILGFFSVYV